MKIMSCKQLGGACEKEFHANSFEEIAEKSKQHCMDMLRINDKDHIQAMKEMQKLMEQPEEMSKWFENKRQEFESLPEK